MTHDSKTDAGALLPLVQNFIDRKYIARADARQKSMGLAYVEAERQDLAREIARFIENLRAPVSPSDAESVRVAEALDDLKTHKDAWRNAIARQCEPFGSDDDGSYWDHELKVFDRTFAALSSPPPVGAREALAPFAKIADMYDDREDDSYQLAGDVDIEVIRKALTLGACRKARAALSPAVETDNGGSGSIGAGQEP